MTLQHVDHPGVATRPTGPELRALLDRAAGFPELAEKYRTSTEDGGPLGIDGLPPLSSEELRGAVWGGIRSGLTRDRGSVLYLGGGTAERPSATLVPADLFAADILRDWQPLGPRDTLLNLSRGTRLWPAHDLCNSLAALSGSSSIPYGSPEGGDLARWVDFFGQCGANALAADTPTIRELLRYCQVTGRRLEWLRTLLWFGTGLDGTIAELIAEVIPRAQVWGLYGSVESWAVAGNGPDCGRNVFHPMRHQYLEVLDGELLVSTLHERAITPLLRYRTGDTAEFATCPCGSPTPAVRLLGRLDDVLSFRGARFSRSELAELAMSVEEVRHADVAVLDAGLPTERLRLRVSLRDGLLADRYQVEWIKECVLGRHLTLSRVLDEAQDSVEVVTADGIRQPAAA
ncbi:hypothetical protein [Streptacidiphilus sp. P02-A3a]|uniref:hypothetical protein n=1 Tax=Streptacidiphilus sp. P02-A3a TaxID=2704468 RepID=UPI0015FC22FA|nr:hypothetical protein [Streptacidiphilus sp. P02-A3a]QMU67027.1 hypothetical protein GXP74_01170 [Streptacidiphilus sp. P02-A3a]